MATIVPRGIRRNQVNQGMSQNGSILDDDAFIKFAQQLADSGVDFSTRKEAQATNVDPELENALGQGNHPGMRNDQQSQMDRQVPPAEQPPAEQQAQPQDETITLNKNDVRFDPSTGKPVNNVNEQQLRQEVVGLQGLIADKIRGIPGLEHLGVGLVAKGDYADGWTFTISPRKADTSKLVSK